MSLCMSVCRSETGAGTHLTHFDETSQPAPSAAATDPTPWNSRLSLPRNVGIGFNAWITFTVLDPDLNIQTAPLASVSLPLPARLVGIGIKKASSGRPRTPCNH